MATLVSNRYAKETSVQRNRRITQMTGTQRFVDVAGSGKTREKIRKADIFNDALLKAVKYGENII